MNRRIIELSNLVELIENGTITIVSVESKVKAFSDIPRTDNVTPKEFIESIQYLNEATLFKNGIDFYYGFTGKNGIRIECALKNPYLDEYFYVDGVINDGVSMDDVDKKFSETFSDGVDKKITM